MSRLATTTRLAALFGLSLAAGVSAYLWIARSPRPRSESLPRAAPPPAAWTPALAVGRPLSGVGAADIRPHSTATVPDAAAANVGPAEHDALSRRATRQLLERALEGKPMGRELLPRDYDQLTDTVLRLRSALRAIRHGSDAAADPAALDEQRHVVVSALDEIARITGVPPSDLGEVLASDADATSQPDTR